MSKRNYDIHLEDSFGGLTLTDVPALIAAKEPWYNETLATINDAVVRLGIIEGDFIGTGTRPRTSSSSCSRDNC